VAEEGTFIKRYVVKLSGEERNRLQVMIRSGKHPAQRLMKARTLLKADTSEAGEGWIDSQIAQALETSVITVSRVGPQLVEEGLDAVLTRKHLPNSARRRIFDGAAEAKPIALTRMSFAFFSCLVFYAPRSCRPRACGARSFEVMELPASAGRMSAEFSYCARLRMAWEPQFIVPVIWPISPFALLWRMTTVSKKTHARIAAIITRMIIGLEVSLYLGSCLVSILLSSSGSPCEAVCCWGKGRIAAH
jgi:hypothetical protein